MTNVTMNNKKFKLLGGEIELVLYEIDELYTEEIYVEFYTKALKLQKIFNLFDPESELSKLNKNRSGIVSEELFEVITKAIKYAKETNGLYDITKGLQIRERKKGLPETKITCSYKDMIIDTTKRSIRLNHPEIIIDLGSIAKGYIVDKLIENLKLLGIENALIDARGDMRIIGERGENIAIEHPRTHESIKPFILKEESVATSGDYNQYFGTYENNHIIGQSDFISLTVRADTACNADVYASCIYLLGTAGAYDFIKNYPEIKFLGIDKNMNIIEQGNWD